MFFTSRNILFFIFFLSVQMYLYAQMPDSIGLNRNILLDEVSIIGQGTPAVYSRVARNITIINSDEIKSSPASTIQDLLEYVSGVDIRQRNIHGVQADIQVRGGTFDQVMILLNGINITDPQTGHFNLDLPVELSAIDRIEILHGSGARIYGANAYKGVINIITRKNINNVSAGLTLGQHNLIHSNISANLTKNKLYNGLSITRNISEGFTTNTDYRLSHLYYQGGLDLKNAGLSWQAGINDKAFGANDFYSPAFPDQYEETSTTFSSLTFSTHGKIGFSGSGYWRRHADHFLLKRNDPSFYENYHLTDVFGTKLNTVITSSFGKTLLGVENRFETIFSTNLGLESEKLRKVKGSDSAVYTKYYSRNTLNTFFEHNYILNKFSFTGGFLVNWNTEISRKIDIFPGLDVSYQLLNKNIKLFCSINRSLRLPGFTDLFYKDPSNEGNADLKPEDLLAFETGLKFNSNNYTANLTFFRDMGKQVIDWIWINDLSLYKAMNIAEITTRGIEVMGIYQIIDNNAKSFLRLNKLGVTYTFINLAKAPGNYESKYSLDYLKHKAGMTAVIDISKKIHLNWSISFSSRNGSYMDYNPGTKSRFIKSFQPYWLNDAKVYYSAKNLQVFTSISNVFNIKYTDVGNLIQPGRWITLGIQLNLSLDH